jgi:hypothetical protein
LSEQNIPSFVDYFKDNLKRLGSVVCAFGVEWTGPFVAPVPRDVATILAAAANLLSLLGLLLVWDLRKALRLTRFAVISSAAGGALVLVFLYSTANQLLSYSNLSYVGPLTYSFGASLLFSAVVALTVQDFTAYLRQQNLIQQTQSPTKSATETPTT